MDLKLTFLLTISLMFYVTTAFNITEILNDYSDFSTFNNFLTQTKLASQINSRQTVTVLVVENGAISSLSGKPSDLMKKILSVHVLLDYYDVKKFQNLPSKTKIITTLFQTSGIAKGLEGFLNATYSSNGVTIGSAAKGSSSRANLVKSVEAKPYNLSVLQISSVIVPYGIENGNGSPYSAPPAKTPKRSPLAPSPDAPASSPGPGPSADTPSDTPASAPDSEGPSADSPKADSSASMTFGLNFAIVSMLVSLTFILT